MPKGGISMSTRRLRPVTLVVTFALGLLVRPLPAEAQQAGKVYQIGYLGPHSFSSRWGSVRRKAFHEGLRELGYVEGQNLVIEERSAEGKRERYPVIAAELVRLKVDVIVTAGNPLTVRAAQGATRTIPIVMSGIVVDPVKAGFVVSLARPGGNITGLTNLDSKLHAKRLELLKEAFPRISRVAILWPLAQQKHAMKEVKAVGQALGIQIQPLVVSSRLGLEGLESALSAISREHSDGLLVAMSSVVMPNRARVIEFTAKRRLPTIYARSRFVKAGGPMSYGTDRQHLYRREATYVDKILKGAKPGDLPIEQPTKFELVINLKTAKQIGVTIPPEVLYQATKVIK
jgi:putative ABC transport system substrate-binding protein